MRWNTKNFYANPVGDYHMRRRWRFALFPTWIQGVMVWLETYQIEEAFFNYPPRWVLSRRLLNWRK